MNTGKIAPQTRLVAALAIVGVAIVAGVASADSAFFYRHKPGLIGNVSGHETLLLQLMVPDPFGLTIGQPIQLPLAGTASDPGVQYRAAASAVMPGLLVNPSTGEVAGTPSGAEYSLFNIVVEAVRDGVVVGTTLPVPRILLAPLVVATVPDDINLFPGAAFPTAGVGVMATGGNPETLSWSLENAPEWLEIAATGRGQGVLCVRSYMTVTETPPRIVTVVASDAEGRVDRSQGFALSVMPQFKLLADDGNDGDDFGHAVALSADGKVALVSAALDSDVAWHAGSAYIFEQRETGWTQRSKLVAADSEAVDYFGYSVALSSDGMTAIIGAFQDDETKPDVGSAYVFDRKGDEWIQRPKLVTEYDDESHHFGLSVSLSADGMTALVGAPAFLDPGYGMQHGAAYVFDWNGSSWTRRPKLVPSNGAKGDGFGTSVSISANGRSALIGSPEHSEDGHSVTGSAYVFDWNGTAWTQRPDMIDADELSHGAWFGEKVSLSASGMTALTGALRPNQPFGYAYVFDWDGVTWAQRPRLSVEEAGRHFGDAVAISQDGTRALVGAPPSGSAYFFDWDGANWLRHPTLLPLDEAEDFGWSVALSGDGTTALIGERERHEDGLPGSTYLIPLP